MHTSDFPDREAAAWLERMQRDRVPETTRAAFRTWLEGSPENRAAYESLTGTWRLLERSGETPSILALRHEAALRLTRRTWPRAPIRTLAAGVALIVLAVGLFAALTPTQFGTRLTVWLQALVPGDQHYRTATGERLAVTLRDGSQVTLDTQSDLEVAFTPSERHVRLIHGQAFFDVAKDKTHPFVVEVNDRRLIAVGTAFDVRMDQAGIRVTMLEGTVRVESSPPQSLSPQTEAVAVSPTPAKGGVSLHTQMGTARPTPGANESPETLITAGEQLWVDGESQDHVLAADVDRITSWRRGQVMFDGTRLADAVAELNRYTETKIELADPALGDLRISGSFVTGRSDQFVEALTTYFPIDVSESTGRSVVLKVRR